MKAWEIIEAIDDPSGLIHPEKSQAIAGRTHPLGAHPAYPQHQAAEGDRSTNYEEVLATRQWQKILTKGQKYLGVPLTARALGTIQQKLMAALNLINQVEAAHKDELEALAVQTVFSLPEFRRAKEAYKNKKIVIDAELTDEVSMEGMMTSDEPEAQKPLSQERNPVEKEWIEKMIQRRHFTNALTQGSAVSNNYLFEYAGAALDRIHPQLRNAYGVLMVSTELGYWMFPQSAVIQGAKNDMQVGSVKVSPPETGQPGQQGEEGTRQNKPRRIKAQGKFFPVLIQELIKGMTEMASLPSLPKMALDREEVTNKADLVDAEAWHMILGPQLWDQFIAATDAENGRQLAMYLYNRIQRLDVDKFNDFMKEILAKSPRGIQMLKQLSQKVRAEIEASGGSTADIEESAAHLVRHLID